MQCQKMLFPPYLQGNNSVAKYKQTKMSSTLNKNEIGQVSSKTEMQNPKIFKIKRAMVSAIAACICAVAILTSCNSPAEDVKDAKENVSKANKDLDKAKKEYAEEMKQFKMEAEEKLTANERAIADINSKLKQSKNEVKAEYKKQAATLEQKNKDLKKQVKAFEADTKEDWLSFKAEFKKDMDELGDALENFVVTD